MEQRIVKLVAGCSQGCPHYGYNSGGQYLCGLVGQDVTGRTTIPAFCPLPLYPTREIARLEDTVRSLQKGVDTHFAEYLFSFIAAKLRLKKEAARSEIDISFMDMKEERKVTMRFDTITAIELRGGLRISFWYEDKTYILHPEDERPYLEEEAKIEGREEPTYFHHRVLTGQE